MAPTVVLYGRPSSLPHVDIGTAAAGFMRGCTYNRVSDFTNKHLWALEAWMKGYRSTATNVTGRIGVYSVDGSMQPASRLGYSGAFTISSATPGGEFGNDIEAVDVSAPSGVTLLGIPLNNANRHTLAILGTGASWAFGMQQAAFITMDNERIYTRSGLSQPPPSSWGSISGSIEGHMVIWLVCETNEPPAKPTSLSPSGDTNGATPTFTAPFVDDNAGDGGTDAGDYLNQFRIQVREVANPGVLLWNATLTSTQTERENAAFSRAYGGSALSLGTTYEWRCQMSDHFEEWSEWSDWTQFTPANFGFITLDSDPTGKVETNQPDFKGRWFHQTAEDMTITQVRIRNAADTATLQTGAEYDISDVSSSALPGTLFTIPWANAGLSNLNWGTSYRYQIRGKDESGEWSQWSASRAFNTNAAPTVPVIVSPTNDLPVSAPPILKATASDADDTTGTGFVVKARIKDDGGSVIATRDMTLNSGVWEYQTIDPDDLDDGFAAYRWDAYSYDGTLYSGEQTVEANAVKSSEGSFIYAEGPDVSIDSPADSATITTASLTVEFTIEDQVKYQVILYETGTTTVVYDSGLITSSNTSHEIPAGSYRNGQVLDLVVIGEDSTPLQGSDIITITIDYPPADPVLNLQCEALSITNDPWPTALRWSWDTSEYGEEWQNYTLKLRASGGPDQTERTIGVITSKTQTSFTYYFPASGYQYIASVTQTILSGVDQIDSEPVEAAGSVELGGVVLVSVANPSTLRTVLRNTKERDYDRELDEAVFQPVARANPTTIRGRKRTPMIAFDAQLITDQWATAATRLAELEALDAAGGVICYRDNHGRKEFVTIPRKPITDKLQDWWEAAVQLRGEHYVEGS